MSTDGEHSRPLNDLPERVGSHELDDQAQRAFESELDPELFLVQKADRRDYGTDYQLEALSEGAVSNLRVHVQLKGTDGAENARGAVDVVVRRTNLNYLLAQPDSLYVCFHRPSGRLFARYAMDVFRAYERRGTPWQHQDTVTVKFVDLFEESFQLRLRNRVLSSGRAARDERLEWSTTPPERLSDSIRKAVPRIQVPEEASLAREVLTKLYSEGEDAVISKAFADFAAVLGENSPSMLPAYMAEINLGVNGDAVERPRVLAGIERLHAAESSGQLLRGSLLYSQGNGWLALGEYERARKAYYEALADLEGGGHEEIAARCSKNLGTVMHHLGDEEAAQKLYERALEFDPHLPEAHYGLGLGLLRRGGDPDAAITHLDAALTSIGRSKIPSSAVAGWKIEALFRAGRDNEAFSLVTLLVAQARDTAWVWPWLAKQVAAHGRSSAASAQRAISFWRSYLAEHPQHVAGRRESLLCHFALRMADDARMDLDSFRSRALELIEEGAADPAFLWDRIGHWAQEDGDWERAEEAFRVAWEMEPSKYGYCLGTALNFLGNFDDALPILRAEAERLQPDAMSWFQVGVASDGLGRWPQAIEAYERAVDLDDTYALAWFNLGGAYWNSGDSSSATHVWQSAVSKFPDHELSSRVVEDFLGRDPRDSTTDDF